MTEATAAYSELAVEPATPDDAEGIVDIVRAAWLDTYPNAELGITEKDVRLKLEGEHGERIPHLIQAWREGLETPRDDVSTFVVREQSQVLGFVASAIWRDGARQIRALNVLPEAQGRGIGSMLFQAAIDWHGREEDIFLYVVSYNRRAADLYKTKYGFEETNTEIHSDAARLPSGKVMPETKMILRAAQA